MIVQFISISNHILNFSSRHLSKLLCVWCCALCENGFLITHFCYIYELGLIGINLHKLPCVAVKLMIYYKWFLIENSRLTVFAFVYFAVLTINLIKVPLNTHMLDWHTNRWKLINFCRKRDTKMIVFKCKVIKCTIDLQILQISKM